MKFSPIQQLIAKHYIGGEFRHADDDAELEKYGDGLFTFLVHEAHDADSPQEFVAMLLTAIDQLHDLVDAIEEDA